jgi:hypothetical protein
LALVNPEPWPPCPSGRISGRHERRREAEAGVELVPGFRVPHLSFVDIDRKTGLLATPLCRFPLREVFFPGTEPSRFCSNQDHLRILDYYSQETATEEH